MPVGNLSKVDDIPTDSYIMPESSEIDFEEIEKAMGILLIYVTRDRRNHYHTQTGILDKEHKEQIKIHVRTFRGEGPLVYSAFKIGLQAVKVGAPFVIPANPNNDILGKITAAAGFGETGADLIKQLYDNSVGANRVEASSQSDHLKSLAEQKRNEHSKYLQEEGDAVRKHEQARNRRDDFMLSMARGQ